MFAFSIQSRSSSPSSGPPGPPCTRRNSLGCHSTPSLALRAASSLCMSSIRVLSSVAASWFRSLRAATVLYHNFCDSRSCCSSSGRTNGGVALAVVASNNTSFLPVCRTIRVARNREQVETQSLPLNSLWSSLRSTFRTVQTGYHQFSHF